MKVECVPLLLFDGYFNVRFYFTVKEMCDEEDL